MKGKCNDRIKKLKEDQAIVCDECGGQGGTEEVVCPCCNGRGEHYKIPTPLPKNQSPAERILDSFGEEAVLVSSDGTAKYGSKGDDGDDIYRAKNQAKTQLRDALLEQVIGEYEATQPSFSNHSDISEIKDMATRDEIRAEQRKALYEFFGGSE